VILRGESRSDRPQFPDDLVCLSRIGFFCFPVEGRRTGAQKAVPEELPHSGNRQCCLGVADVSFPLMMQFKRVAIGINILYAMILVVLAVYPRIPSLGVLSPSDVLAHASAYGLQAALLFWLFSGGNSLVKAGLYSLLGATAFGFFTEILQLASRTRHFEMADVSADFLGSALVLGILFLIRFRRGTFSA